MIGDENMKNQSGYGKYKNPKYNKTQKSKIQNVELQKNTKQMQNDTEK